MAVGMGCSLAFLTPIASPTNTIAYTIGGYKFSDFFKVGGVLQLLLVAAGCVLLPIFFPF
jgi:di/tricarboxylate transporter